MSSARDLTTEHRCQSAVEFYSAIEATSYVSLARHAGADSLDAIIARLLGDHMEAHFLDGLSKLGIEPGTPDAVQCALYHVLSNELGGYKVGYVRESNDKAWIFYDAPYVEAHPWMGVAYAGFRPSYWIEQMLNWHAYDGEALGNPGIAFVSTHFVSLGDPYDAGYFIDTHHELEQSQRLQFNLGEMPPEGMQITYPLNDPSLWPHERRIKAHRNYARDYASAILAAIVRTVPAEQARSIIEFVIRTVLFSQTLQLQQLIGPVDGEGTVERVARVLALIEDLAASMDHETSVTLKGDGAVVRPVNGPALLSSAEWQTATDEQRNLVAQALGDAWTAWASHLARDIAVELDLTDGTWSVEQSEGARHRNDQRVAERRTLALADLMALA